MRRTLLHFACAFLLLNAQLGALTHSVWHLHDHFPAHAHQDHTGAAPHDGDEAPSSQGELCIFHAALGSLFAGGCAEKPVLEQAGSSTFLATSPAERLVARFAVVPPSRAPPVLI